MENPLYPLLFETIFKDKIWGGSKIKSELGKEFSPLPNCGETWEISGVEGNVSVVKNGPLQHTTLTSLITKYKEQLLGQKSIEKYGLEFPLLVKFIDANEDLSIQVHPNDDLATLRHQCKGKTEMWYIFQADEGSSLISGFNRPLDKDAYLEAFNNGTLLDILNVEKVSSGDVFFLPAGRIHTIGKGLLLAEIQQTSDITYRIYDFDRVDNKGNKRELHTELALDALDFKHYRDYKTRYTDSYNVAVPLVRCAYFETNKLILDQAFDRDISGLDSFVIYVCFEGSARIEYSTQSIEIKKGDAVLIPASLTSYRILPLPMCQLLEAYVV